MKQYKYIFACLCCSISLYSTQTFAQYDSTNLSGLSTSHQTLNNTSSGSGVPDPAVLSPSTSYTETMVQACPSSGGNGYGYYPNGPVPADGTNVAGQTVTGGVVYDQTVTTNRFGTTTYSGWYQVNFLCTAIPYPPGCPSGEVQTVAPYWDWGSNSWQGLQCQQPVTYSTFFYPVPCVAYNEHWDGTTSALIYQANRNGVITYFQMISTYQGWIQEPVLVDGSGQYYATALGDVWGQTSPSSGEPMPALYGLGLTQFGTQWNPSTMVAPGYPAPSGSPQYCTFSSGH